MCVRVYVCVCRYCYSCVSHRSYLHNDDDVVVVVDDDDDDDDDSHACVTDWLINWLIDWLFAIWLVDPLAIHAEAFKHRRSAEPSIEYMPDFYKMGACLPVVDMK